MKKLVALLAIAVALSSIGVMAIQSVSAAPADPYNPYAPGIRQSTSDASAKDFAPGQQYPHVGSPTDPYKFAPGHLLKDGVVIGPDG